MKVHVQSTFLCLQTTKLPSTCQEPLAPFETNVLLFNRREFLSSIPRGSISFIMFATKLRGIWIWWRSLRACQCLCTLINFEGLLFLHEWHILFRNHLLSWHFLSFPFQTETSQTSLRCSHIHMEDFSFFEETNNSVVQITIFCLQQSFFSLQRSFLFFAAHLFCLQRVGHHRLLFGVRPYILVHRLPSSAALNGH